MVSLGGVACGWSNQSSKETIEVAVARPATADRDTAKQMAAAGTPFPGYGVEAYFSKDANTGVVQAFSGEYWILVQSVAFYEAGDAARLMDPLLKSLR